jgi:glutathionylspermidine amidase/synthetase
LAPYNTIVGYASTNVAAYSNGNDSHTPEESSYLYKVYTGIKWQCVEFARRWLFIRKGCVFHEIVGAADIWTEVDNVQRVVDRKCFNFQKYPNGSPSPPKNESLLIYKRSPEIGLYGHVAVIVDVLVNSIRVAEENYDAYYWSGNYSREIPYVVKDGKYYIEDKDPISGWMSLNDNNQTKPLDQQTIDEIIKLNGTSPDFICRNNTI